jgi:hypothetical protein
VFTVKLILSKCGSENSHNNLRKIDIERKILGFHGGDYDDYHLLGDDAVWLVVS